MFRWRTLAILLLVGGMTASGSAADQESILKTAAVVPENQPAPVDPLNIKVERAIAASNYRVLTAGQHTPWQIVHAILALKQDCMLNTADGKKISAIEWLATSRFHDGAPLWEKTPYGGRGHPFTKPYAFEGHPTQFLGYMSMCDLPLDHKFQTGDGSTITVRDIVNDAKMQLREGPEVTWTLWALAHYLPPNAEWINAYGEAWSMERMVQVQTHESVLSAACGGTHGLFVLAYARNRYIATGQPLRGVWLEADQKIRRFVQEARSLQNSDGSFSVDYFQGPRHSSEFSVRLPANGHMLEWLMIALPQQDLKQEWVRRGVESVADDLYTNRKVPVDCGPLYHAVDALNLYNYRTNPNPRPLAFPITGKRRLEVKEAARLKEVEAKAASEKTKETKPTEVNPTEAKTTDPSLSGDPKSEASPKSAPPEITPEGGKTLPEGSAAPETVQPETGKAPAVEGGDSPTVPEEKKSSESPSSEPSEGETPPKSTEENSTESQGSSGSSDSSTSGTVPATPPPPE